LFFFFFFFFFFFGQQAMHSPRSQGQARDQTYPAPTPNFRYSGYLLKLGEGRAAWKQRFFHIDSTTGYLYWWNKPNGKVLGAVPLLESTKVVVVPDQDFTFKLVWGSRHRVFRSESQAQHDIWIRHLAEEIAVRSGGRPEAHAPTTSASPPSGQPMAPVLEKVQSTSSAAASPKVAQKSGPSSETYAELESEVARLRQRVRELEEDNRLLKEEAASDEEGDAEAEAAAKMLQKMNLDKNEGGAGGAGGGNGGDANLKEKIEDLTFQLNSTKKRLKAANETIKLQAARIQALEKKE
jgi:hypothetical protein